MTVVNRRRFLQGFSAAGLVPFMPAMPVMAAPAAAAHTSIQYTWACYYAQMNNACSVSQITSALGFRPEVAQGLFDRLVTQNIVTTPNVAGLSMSRKRLEMAARKAAKSAAIRFDPDQLMAEVTRDNDGQLPFTPAEICTA